MQMKRKKAMVYWVTGMVLLGGGFSGGLMGCAEKDSVSADSTAEPVSSVSQSVTASLEMFTDRDKEAGYDEENSAKITLTDNGSVCDSDAVEIVGNKITITDEGTYILSGELTDGMVIVEAEDTDKVQLVLNGVSITSAESAAIYVRTADKVFLTTAAESENVLTNGGTYTAIDDNNIDAVIFSKDDLTLNGAGTLTVSATAGHGVVSKDDLVLTSGTYDITAEKQGLSGKDSVRIAEGNYTLTTGTDGIHASNTDDASLGFVYIEGGSFSIAAEDDGIHADLSTTIAGGTIDIVKSYEGIEGLSIDITGGEISVSASDDGLNAAGGNDSSGIERSAADGTEGGAERGREDMFATEEGAYIHISGGTLQVDASGDGIDSNGNLTVSGGTTYVSGPTSDGNGTMDYNGEAVITGGVFAAAGSSGMAQNFGSSSTQGVMLVNVDAQPEGSVIALTDSSGTELISWTADKAYSSVIVSCPEIKTGEEYTLTAGSSTQEIVMDSLIYGSGGMAGGMGGLPGQDGQKRGEPKGMPPGQNF